MAVDPFSSVFTQPDNAQVIDDFSAIATPVLAALPNPVLVKDDATRYVWVNPAFEALFSVTKDEVVGQLDADLFPTRQAAQCNGGDLRVLETGEIDEAGEVVVDPELGERHVITRKSRITHNGERFLVGVLHDVSEVVSKNERLTELSMQLSSQAQELERLASTDPLTQCLNRRALAAASATVSADQIAVGVLSIDIDHFKRINDQFGHDAGDTVLADFARLVRTIVRSTDVVARVGGEEFVVLMPSAPQHVVEAAGERIRKAVAANELIYDGSPISYTVSIGVAHAADDAPTVVETLLRQADKRLYAAKDSGRNLVISN